MAATWLIPAVAVGLLAGCGDSGGDDDDVSVRPTSLNGVSLNFGGAKITFSTPTPNTVTGGTEVGGLVYERLNKQDVVFTPSDSSGLDPAELKWPLDVGGSTRYEYTPLSAVTGQLLIYPDNRELETFLYESDSFETIILTFTASGGVIVAIDAVMTIVQPVDKRYVTSFTPTGSLGALGDDERDIPAGWDGVNKGPGFIAVPSFDGQILTLNQDGGDVEIQFGPFQATSALTVDENSTTQSGTVSILVTRNLQTPGTETVDTYEADYTQVQPYGTENVELKLVYTSGTTAALPPNETVTLAFTGGESLTSVGSTVKVRTGIYTRPADATSGTFILDTR